MCSPSDMVRAPDGRIFVADTQNNRVRLISNGVMTTYAGNGDFGTSGDGGAATAAAIYAPSGLAVAPDGSVLVSDGRSHRVRRIWPGGGAIGGRVTDQSSGAAVAGMTVQLPDDRSRQPGRHPHHRRERVLRVLGGHRRLQGPGRGGRRLRRRVVLERIERGGRDHHRGGGWGPGPRRHRPRSLTPRSARSRGSTTAGSTGSGIFRRGALTYASSTHASRNVRVTCDAHRGPSTTADSERRTRASAAATASASPADAVGSSRRPVRRGSSSGPRSGGPRRLRRGPGTAWRSRRRGRGRAPPRRRSHPALPWCRRTGRP